MPRYRILRPSSLARTIDRICAAVVLLVLVLGTFRWILRAASDPNKCDSLLKDGQWLDRPNTEPLGSPYRNWQAPGCIIHEYNTVEIAECNEKGKILFVGDSSARQLFWTTVKMMDSGFVARERKKLDPHDDISFSKENAHIKFLWDPWLNSSRLYDELNDFRKRRELKVEDEVTSESTELVSENEMRRSVAILISGGLWHARHIVQDSAKHFQDSINKIVEAAYSSGTAGGLRTAPLSSREGIQDHIFFAPILEPQYELLSPSRQNTVLPEKIDRMNDYLQDLSLHRSLSVLWSYSNMTRGIPEAYAESGMHVRESFAKNMVNILLNLRCNAKASLRGGYPFNRTCCSGYKRVNLAQFSLVLATLIILMKKCLRSRGLTLQGSLFASANVKGNPSVSLLTMLTLACFCHIADRTHFLDQVQKQYGQLDFQLLFLVPFIGCAVWIKGPPPSAPHLHRPNSFHEPETQSTFLPRHQTEEWKGWMQLFCLSYSYTAASSRLDLYEVSRILVPSYLFMTGYGHALYFLQKKDYSFQRVADVMLRLNLLPILLSMAMNRPYASYYFSPLSSFWFFVVYFTLKCSSHRNDSLPFVVGKIALSGVIVTLVIRINGLLEFVAFIFRITFHAMWDVKQWRYILSVDNYIVLVGVLVALLHIHFILRSGGRSQPGRFVSRSMELFDVVRAFIVSLAAIAIPVFWIITRRSPDKADYDWWMPFLSWIPIVSFVVLRNCTSFLRHYHSAAFAWLGRISLETYLLSHHIWMAGDGTGLLSTGLFDGNGTLRGDRWRDFMIFTCLFIWSSWKTAAASTTVRAWISGVESNVPAEATPENGWGKCSEPRVVGKNSFTLAHSISGLLRKGESESGLWPTDFRMRLAVFGLGVWLCSVLT